jgi:cation transporter-like permease
MKIKRSWINVLIVAMALGTGHAIRGQFGHEHGAAWAGAIGGLALVLVSGRKDWYKKAFLVALAMAFGWGAGGMMSYGQIAGRYAQSDNIPNIFYGLLMLFIIGGLYGLIGGGFTGLTLNSSGQNKVKWGNLIAEMVAGGLVSYGFLVKQLEIRMTPPRGDEWAICLGAGLALVWYMARNRQFSPIRVAFYTALGGGFGFAFGTFFHLVMNMIKLPFNTWNMAEYSIGFFGGIGLAWGVFSSKWPDESNSPKKWENITAMLVLLFMVPLIIFKESFSYSIFVVRLQHLANGETIAFWNTLSAAVIIAFIIFFGWWILVKSAYEIKRREVATLFIVYATAYAVLSYITTGLFHGVFVTNSNHHLYLVNIIAIVWLSRKNYPAFFENPTSELRVREWLLVTILAIISIFLMACISIYLHGPTDATYDRFHL